MVILIISVSDGGHLGFAKMPQKLFIFLLTISLSWIVG